jgi:HK97 family phage major capsid protein
MFDIKDVRDPKYDHLKGLSVTERIAERNRLAGQANTILERAGGVLDEEAERAFTEVEEQLQFLAHLTKTHERMIAMASDPEGRYYELGSPERQNTVATPHPLKGKLTLTRGESVADWSRDNQHTKDTASPESFDRYIRGLVTGDWSGADEERALSEGTNTAGGHLVPTPLANTVIDLARNASRVMEAGATVVPMTSQTLRIPRLTGEGSPQWRAELATITAQDMTFDAVTLTAKSLDRLILISNELFQDSSPNASDVIANSFAQQIALALDLAALRGDGTGATPLGIKNTAGVTVTAHGANGASLTHDFLLDSAAAVRAANFEPNAHIAAPRAMQSLSKAKDSTGQYLAPPAGSLPLLTTGQIPVNGTTGTSSDTSEIFTGQWNQLLIGIRAGFTLRVLTERYADQGAVAFLANLRADVAVAHPTAFVVDTGIRG